MQECNLFTRVTEAYSVPCHADMWLLYSKLQKNQLLATENANALDAVAASLLIQCPAMPQCRPKATVMHAGFSPTLAVLLIRFLSTLLHQHEIAILMPTSPSLEPS